MKYGHRLKDVESFGFPLLHIFWVVLRRPRMNYW